MDSITENSCGVLETNKFKTTIIDQLEPQSISSSPSPSAELNKPSTSTLRTLKSENTIIFEMDSSLDNPSSVLYYDTFEQPESTPSTDKAIPTKTRQPKPIEISKEIVKRDPHFTSLADKALVDSIKLITEHFELLNFEHKKRILLMQKIKVLLGTLSDNLSMPCSADKELINSLQSLINSIEIFIDEKKTEKPAFEQIKLLVYALLMQLNLWARAINI